jgi:hypothetical protein
MALSSSASRSRRKTMLAKSRKSQHPARVLDATTLASCFAAHYCVVAYMVSCSMQSGSNSWTSLFVDAASKNNKSPFTTKRYHTFGRIAFQLGERQNTGGAINHDKTAEKKGEALSAIERTTIGNNGDVVSTMGLNEILLNLLESSSGSSTFEQGKGGSSLVEAPYATILAWHYLPIVDGSISMVDRCVYLDAVSFGLHTQGQSNTHADEDEAVYECIGCSSNTILLHISCLGCDKDKRDLLTSLAAVKNSKSDSKIDHQLQNLEHCLDCMFRGINRRFASFQQHDESAKSKSKSKSPPKTRLVLLVDSDDDGTNTTIDQADGTLLSSSTSSIQNNSIQKSIKRLVKKRMKSYPSIITEDQCQIHVVPISQREAYIDSLLKRKAPSQSVPLVSFRSFVEQVYGKLTLTLTSSSSISAMSEDDIHTLKVKVGREVIVGETISDKIILPSTEDVQKSRRAKGNKLLQAVLDNIMLPVTVIPTETRKNESNLDVTVTLNELSDDEDFEMITNNTEAATTQQDGRSNKEALHADDSLLTQHESERTHDDVTSEVDKGGIEETVERDIIDETAFKHAPNGSQQEDGPVDESPSPSGNENLNKHVTLDNSQETPSLPREGKIDASTREQEDGPTADGGGPWESLGDGEQPSAEENDASDDYIDLEQLQLQSRGPALSTSADQPERDETNFPDSDGADFATLSFPQKSQESSPTSSDIVAAEIEEAAEDTDETILMTDEGNTNDDDHRDSNNDSILLADACTPPTTTAPQVDMSGGDDILQATGTTDDNIQSAGAGPDPGGDSSTAFVGGMNEETGSVEIMNDYNIISDEPPPISPAVSMTSDAANQSTEGDTTHDRNDQPSAGPDPANDVSDLRKDLQILSHLVLKRSLKKLDQLRQKQDDAALTPDAMPILEFGRDSDAILLSASADFDVSTLVDKYKNRHQDAGADNSSSTAISMEMVIQQARTNVLQTLAGDQGLKSLFYFQMDALRDHCGKRYDKVLQDLADSKSKRSSNDKGKHQQALVQASAAITEGFRTAAQVCEPVPYIWLKRRCVCCM